MYKGLSIHNSFIILQCVDGDKFCSGTPKAPYSKTDPQPVYKYSTSTSTQTAHEYTKAS